MDKMFVYKCKKCGRVFDAKPNAHVVECDGIIEIVGLSEIHTVTFTYNDVKYTYAVPEAVAKHFELVWEIIENQEKEIKEVNKRMRLMFVIIDKLSNISNESS